MKFVGLVEVTNWSLKLKTCLLQYAPTEFTTTVDVNINGIRYKNLKIDNNTVRVANAFPATGSYDIFIESDLRDKHNKEVNGLNIKTQIIKF